MRYLTYLDVVPASHINVAALQGAGAFVGAYSAYNGGGYSDALPAAAGSGSGMSGLTQAVGGYGSSSIHDSAVSASLAQRALATNGRGDAWAAPVRCQGPLIRPWQLLVDKRVCTDVCMRASAAADAWLPCDWTRRLDRIQSC